MPDDPVARVTPAQVGADPRGALQRAIKQEYPALLRAAETLAWRAGITRDRDAVKDLAAEALNEAVARALLRAEQFDAERSAYAWLLRFAFNVLRERREHAFRDRTHTQSLDVRSPGTDGSTPGLSLAERLFDPASLSALNVAELLDLVAPLEQCLLRLRFVAGLSGRELAQELGVSEGAARVRLSRAVQSLTAAYHRADRE